MVVELHILHPRRAAAMSLRRRRRGEEEEIDVSLVWCQLTESYQVLYAVMHHTYSTYMLMLNSKTNAGMTKPRGTQKHAASTTKQLKLANSIQHVTPRLSDSRCRHRKL